LIIDEAQRLNNKLIDQIRVLSNIELSDRKLINIFLVGQPEFKNMLMANINRPLRQRIAVNYHIEPLSEAETRTYIEYRMAVAGASWDIFEPSALREVYRYTAGFPRAINIICDHALLTGYASGADTIDAAIIQECENELRISKGSNNSYKQSNAQQSPVPARWPEIQKRPEPAAPPGPAAPSPSQPRPASPPASLPQTFVTAPRSHRGRSGIYSLMVGACILLTALAGYFWLWPQTSDTIQMPAVEETDKLEPAPEGPSEAQTPQTPPPAAAQPERSQLNSPTGDTVPQDSTTDSGAEPSAGEVLASVTAAPAASETEPVSPGLTPEDRENAGKNAGGDLTASDGQAIADAAETAPTPDPSDGAADRPGDLSLPGKSLTAMATLSAALVTEAEKNAQATDGGDSSAAQAASPEPPRATTRPATPAEATPPATAVTAQPKPVTRPPERKSAPEIPPAKAGAAATAESASPAATAPKPKPAPNPELKQTAPTGKPPSGAGATEPASKAANLAASAANPPSPANPAPAAQVPPASPTAGKPGGTTQMPAVATARTMPAAGNATLEKIGLEERLDQFLEDYCDTYTSKNLDAFADLFAAGATENGQPFRSLLPKYEKNFNLIDTIQYRIRMKDFSVEEDQTVTVNGDFFLEWLPPDKRWRENSGKISMRLKNDGSSFRVQRLDYQGAQSKKK
jgi:hypothetical protein